MIPDVRQLLEAKPFEQFAIVTSGGREYRVATAGHADISPNGSRLVIWFDDDSSVTVSGLQITAIETKLNGAKDQSASE